jgi:hypothetical protein
MASEPDDEPLVGRFEAVPERLEIVWQPWLMGVRPPRGPLARCTPGDWTTAQVVRERQDFLLVAGNAHRFLEAFACRITRCDVQDHHALNYALQRLWNNQTSVAL